MWAGRLRYRISEVRQSSYRDIREAHVESTPEHAFVPIRCIGGAAGWYYLDWLWRLRGLVDRVFGGPGFTRGRRSQEDLQVGDAVDCFRVESYEEDRFLRLALEMKSPGRGWLEFEVSSNGHHTRIRQTVIFEPKGLLGRIYWYAESPFHFFLIPGLMREIAKRADGTGIVLMAKRARADI